MEDGKECKSLLKKEVTQTDKVNAILTMTTKEVMMKGKTVLVATI